MWRGGGDEQGGGVLVLLVEDAEAEGLQLEGEGVRRAVGSRVFRLKVWEEKGVLVAAPAGLPAARAELGARRCARLLGPQEESRAAVLSSPRRRPAPGPTEAASSAGSRVGTPQVQGREGCRRPQRRFPFLVLCAFHKTWRRPMGAGVTTQAAGSGGGAAPPGVRVHEKMQRLRNRIRQI